MPGASSSAIRNLDLIPKFNLRTIMRFVKFYIQPVELFEIETC